MTHILVDTTVWIDFFRLKEKSIQADILYKLIEEEYSIRIASKLI